MPVLPSGDDLGYKIPRAQRAVVPVPVGGMSRALQGVAQVGRAIVKQKLAERDKTEYAQARATFLKEKVQIDREVAKLPDWGQYEPEYRKRIADARAQAEAMISSDRVRQAFDNDVVVDIERGVSGILAVADKKEVDYKRGALTEFLDQNRDTALEARSEDDRAAIIDTVSEALQGAEQQGIISAQERVKWADGWQNSYSKGRLDMMSPSEQVKVLQGENPLSKSLAPDERSLYLKAAHNDLRIAADRARVAAERAERERRKAMMSQIGDVLVDRARTKNEMYEMIEGTDLSPSERNNVAAHWESRKKALIGDIHVNAIANAKNGEAPSVEDEVELRAAGKWKSVEDVLSGKDIVTDWDVFTTLTQLPDQDLAKVNPMEYRDKLADTEYKKIVAAVKDAREGKGSTAKSLRTDTQLLNDVAATVGVKLSGKRNDNDAKKARAFIGAVDDAVLQKQEELKRSLTDREKREVIEAQAVEIVTQQGWLYDNTAFRYQLDAPKVPANVEDEVIAAWNDPNYGPEWFKRTLGIEGNRLTPDVIAEAYEKMQVLQGGAGDTQ